MYKLRRFHAMLMFVTMGIFCSLIFTGCGNHTAVSSGADSSESMDAGSLSASGDMTESLAADKEDAPPVKEKPRLVEDESGEASLERALMKANQVQNEGDAVIYSVGREKKHDRKNYSIFVYMVGSDLEASFGYATRDMKEMMDSGIDFTDTNLVIYAGGSRMWKSDIPSNQNNILDMSLEEGERVVAATKNTSDMGAPETLAAFLEYGVDHYPADHYALVFWDHGGGSVFGYGNDTLYSGDSLLLSELDAVLKASPFGEKGSAHLDLVGFDACLMCTAENAVLWSRYADYMVASEETEPGDGWCYSFLKTFNEKSSTEDIGKAIVDAYSAYYEEKRSPLNDPDITLAVLDLKKTAAFVDSLNAMVIEMEKDISQQKFPELVRTRTATKMFGLRDSRSNAYDLLDVGDLAARLKEKYPNAAGAVEKALSELIIYSTDEVEESCGLSLYFPGENRELYEASVSAGNENLYISDVFAGFVKKYAEKWMTASDVDWTLPDFSKSGEEVTVQLSEEQIKNLDKATYTVLIDLGDGFYRRGICKVEIRPDENNVLHIPTNPTLIYASGDLGTMSVPCAFVQSESRESAATYDSMRMFFCYGADITSGPYDHVIATVEESGGNFSVKSFRYDENAVSTGGKNTVDIGEYSTLNEYTADTVYPTRDKDGVMLPYYSWERRGGSFIAYCLQIDESLHFVGKRVSELGMPTVVQVILRDINGTEHGSEICDINDGTKDVVKYRQISRETDKGKLTFEVHGSEVWLTEYNGEDVTLDIPSQVDGYPLVRIDDSAINSAHELRELVIPEGVTSLGHHAVGYASSLKELTLPSTLETVAREPIHSVGKLERISVNGKSSAVCSKDGVLFSADGKILIKYPDSRGRFYTVPEGTETIAFGAFCDADIFGIEFPSTLRSIENYAFEGCESLGNLDFPDSLERIGTGAFSEEAFFGEGEARIISTVKIGANVSRIGLEAFSGHPIERFEVSPDNQSYSVVNGMITSKAGDVVNICPAEIGGSVIVPEGVVGLSPGVFSKLPSTTAFYFPDSLVRMDIDDFPRKKGDNYENVYELTIYCSEGSAAETFAVKNDLDYVIVESDELNLQSYTNEMIPALNGSYRFRVYDDHAVFTSYTGNDGSISVPSKVKGVPVTEIGDGEKAVYGREYSFNGSAFSYKNDETEVTNLGIYEADDLKHIEIPDTVTRINDGAFADLSIKIEELRLPDNLEVIGPRAFGGRYSESSIGSFVIAEKNPNYMTKDGVLFTKDGKTLVKFPTKAKTDLPAITITREERANHYCYQIPDGCESIGKFAFADAELIEAGSSLGVKTDNFEIKFSGDVKLVDDFAFYDSYVTAVEMNEGIEKIGNSAFESVKLETDTLSLPSTVLTIGESAFKSVYRSRGESSNLIYGFSHIDLPEGLKSIGKNAFSSYSESHLLCDELVIGKKLTDIADDAFQYFYTSGFAVDVKNPSYSSVDGCLLDGKGETLITVPQGYKGELRVPACVKKIRKYALFNCDGVTDLYIGSDVSNINPQAIYPEDESAPVIHGVSGSEAERFAVSRGYKWKEEIG